jgi:hypothetical protein
VLDGDATGELTGEGCGTADGHVTGDATGEVTGEGCDTGQPCGSSSEGQPSVPALPYVLQVLEGARRAVLVVQRPKVDPA